MGTSRFSRVAARVPRARGRRVRVGAVAATALFAGITAGSMAGGATTVAPAPEAPGNVVRESGVTINVNPGGQVQARNVLLVAGANWTAITDPLVATTLCAGDNPAGTNRSPRSSIVVTGPDGATVLTANSPAKSLNALSEDYGKPLVPQPAPGNSNYRGGPWSTTLNLAGKPAGTYTITTTIQHMTKNGTLGACTIGSAPLGTAGAISPGVLTQTTTFEYRPWQQRFDDYFGGGSVRFNVSPAEFTYTVGGQAAPVTKGTDGARAMSFFALPDAASFTPPADPLGCAGNPSACLPAVAAPCDPGAGCVPRLVVIDHTKGTDRLVGVFDLETGAFVAYAKAGAKTRVLASGGTDVDTVLRGALKGVVDAAAAAGVDLPLLLSQPVVLKLDDGTTTTELTVSVLEGIELLTRPTVRRPASGTTLGAGLIVHIATWTPTPETIPTGYGYTVQEAGILPAIPSGLPAPANLLLSGGKLRHVVGRVPENGGQHVIALAADTQPGEPNGLPIWLPIVSGAATVADSGIEFIGDDMIVASIETCILGVCLGLGALVGTGVALFPTSPLDGILSIGDIPALWNDCIVETTTVSCPGGPIQLVTTLDGVLQDVAGQVLANPAVQDALAQLDPILGPLLEDVPIPSL